ncbi:hypothetical protein O9G_001902 [Rozella allomycis CSF55]|uniref:Uncharacterized protein n=1 Tax=Rozella allomycis (strain CSF55) TaxID=988480 RepID=A0A075AWE2_ROZAC|nr:hypothetical protein O9G_001902 [Rozella allomycis CSF55]|eukprot:EPZ34600.1 hypothetical protein O9G_001902 [Rozella allomycis CSF55]
MFILGNSTHVNYGVCSIFTFLSFWKFKMSDDRNPLTIEQIRMFLKKGPERKREKIHLDVPYKEIYYVSDFLDRGQELEFLSRKDIIEMLYIKNRFKRHTVIKYLTFFYTDILVNHKETSIDETCQLNNISFEAFQIRQALLKWIHLRIDLFCNHKNIDPNPNGPNWTKEMYDLELELNLYYVVLLLEKFTLNGEVEIFDLPIFMKMIALFDALDN